MPLDAVSNFVRGSTDAAVDSTQTSVSVADASIFPDPSTEGEYNVVIWDVDTNPRPDQDPDVEILRVTAIDTGTNTLTVTRGQETTAGAAHPSGSAVHLSPTAKMFGDIESTFGDFWDATSQELTADVNNGVVNTEQIGSERHYAGSYNGSDPDTRLDNALSAVGAGDIVFLENANYNSTHTIPTRLRLDGCVAGVSPTFAASLTLDAQYVTVRNILIQGASLELNQTWCEVQGCFTSAGGQISVGADNCILKGIKGSDVLFQSGTSGGLIDSSVSTSVTDNGTNTVGDVS